MSSKHLTATPDTFAKVFSGLLEEVELEVKTGSREAVTNSCKTGKRVVKNLAPKRYGGYSRSFSYKVKQEGHAYSGEIGNKRFPGLVHLLEKGHAKVGGGRVDAYPHVKDAADVAFAKFEEEMDKLIGDL